MARRSSDAETRRGTMSRKRSPRISAQLILQDEGIGTSSKTIKMNNKKFSNSKLLTKQVWKGREGHQKEHEEDDGHNLLGNNGLRSGSRERQMIKENVQHGDDGLLPNGNGASSTIMPSKEILELVLDTLQRRDTYEIFAEPVDPDEVEDYYEIIKEPMDFGTMRAKLHEDMYENLQQFEHDVFLIPGNAMHFNSSNTIYFKQARALHELAEKVFHALKTDPENFLLEFSGTRRRSMRRALCENQDSRHPPPIPIKSSGALGTKEARHSRKKSQPADCNINAPSKRDGLRLSSTRPADRRATYREPLWRTSSTSCIDNNDGGCSKQHALVLMNEGGDDGTRYMNSLMSFVKDLGPIAQMVARRKLHSWWSSSSSNSLPRDKVASIHDFALPPLKKKVIIDLTKSSIEDGEEEIVDGGKRKRVALVDNGSKKLRAKGVRTIDGHTNEEEKRIVSKTTSSSSSRWARARDDELTVNVRSTSVRGGRRPVVLALENSHHYSSTATATTTTTTIAASATPRRCKKLIVSSNSGLGLSDHHNETRVRRQLIRQSPAAALPPQQQLVVNKPSSSTPFTFDLPFLKARLNQMNYNL